MAERRGRRLAYRLQGWGAALAFAIFRILPLDVASGIGGAIARTIGPRLGASKRARLNLRRAMPELSEAEIEKIVFGMWDNIGRVICEYPHIARLKIDAPDSRIELVGVDTLRRERKPDKRYIFFSAHYGNWEIGGLAAARAGFAVSAIYRAANNPFIDRMILRERRKYFGEPIPKGAVAARRALAAMAEGRDLSMLVDQKMNDGIAVPFFGRPAMTAPALARLALRFDCAVVPVKVERIGGAHFRLTCEPPLALPKSGNSQADTLSLMTEVNATIERWIRARPEQWFWLHRRWPD